MVVEAVRATAATDRTRTGLCNPSRPFGQRTGGMCRELLERGAGLGQEVEEHEGVDGVLDKLERHATPAARATSASRWLVAQRLVCAAWTSSGGRPRRSARTGEMSGSAGRPWMYDAA